MEISHQSPLSRATLDEAKTPVAELGKRPQSRPISSECDALKAIQSLRASHRPAGFNCNWTSRSAIVATLDSREHPVIGTLQHVYNMGSTKAERCLVAQ